MSSSGVEQPADSRPGRRHQAAAGRRHRLFNLAHALGVVPEGWKHADRGTMTKPALVVIGAWVVLAWNRLGPQALLNPRALTRFALVGLYGWLGLALGLWLMARLRQWAIHGVEQTVMSPASFVRLVGLAHRPLLVAAFAVMILQLTSIIELRTAVGMVAVLLWMPGRLVVAVTWVER